MWNGAFTFQKSIGTITFVPISRMTARDWRWLDFDNCRTVAQNRIARYVLQGSLRGFFQVMITEKAAKNEYFWPVTPGMLVDFESSNDMSFFTNDAEALTTSDALEALDSLRRGIAFLSPALILGIVKILKELSESEENLEELNAIEQGPLLELEEEYLTLLLAAIMLWEMELEEAEAVLDDIPESDEADEVRNWIEDQVATISQARRRLAAGQGL